MSVTLEILREKLNKACVQLIDGKPCCTLCDAKLPNKANFDSHTKGSTHRINSTSTFKQLMNAVLLPGITMRGNNAGDTTNIYCILCDQLVSNLFNSSFHDHINSSGHQSKVIQQANKEKAIGLDTFYKSSFRLVNGDENAFLKGVSRAGIIIADDGHYHCVPCDGEFTSKEQFLAHVQEETHREWVFGQLSKVADKVGISLGIIIRSGSLVCKLCDCKLGNGLATNDAYLHAIASATDSHNEHQKKVKKQSDDGLYEYYDKNQSSALNIGAFYIPYDYSANEIDLDPEEWALQSFHWDDLSSDEELMRYMIFDQMYNGNSDDDDDDNDDDDDDDEW